MNPTYQNYQESSAITTPYSENAEKGVLSVIIKDGVDALDQAELRGLKEEHFFNPVHRKYYNLYVKQIRSNGVTDMMQIREVIGEQEIERMGGTALLVELYTYVTSDCLFNSHIDTMVEKYIKRELINKCQESVEASLDADLDSAGIISSLNLRS